MMERNDRHIITKEVASHDATTPFCVSDQDTKKLEWYALRLYFPGPKKMLRVKEIMDKHGIESFMPTKYATQENGNGSTKRVLVPAISDLIIIKAPANALDRLKAEHPDELQNLAYRRDFYHDGSWGEPIRVSERDMREFMNVVSGNEDSLEFIDIKELEGKTGRPVRIIAGQFKGVEGILMRVEQNRHVIVRLKDLICASLNHIPISRIQFLS